MLTDRRWILPVRPLRALRIGSHGRQHAGENLTDLLQRRVEQSSAIQMCDALSRNTPKLTNGAPHSRSCSARSGPQAVGNHNAIIFAIADTG